MTRFYMPQRHAGSLIQVGESKILLCYVHWRNGDPPSEISLPVNSDWLQNMKVGPDGWLAYYLRGFFHSYPAEGGFVTENNVGGYRCFVVDKENVDYNGFPIITFKEYDLFDVIMGLDNVIAVTANTLLFTMNRTMPGKVETYIVLMSRGDPDSNGCERWEVTLFNGKNCINDLLFRKRPYRPRPKKTPPKQAVNDEIEALVVEAMNDGQS